MQNIKLISISLILTLSLFFLSACGGGSNGNDSSTFTIGVLTSGSGSLESFGPSVKIALDLATNEINELLANEDADFSVVTRTEDTGGDPVVALEKLKLFAAEGIKVVIGPLSSAEAEALREYSLQQGIVLVSPTSTAISLARSDDLLLRLVQNDRGQAAAITAALRYFRTSFYVPVWRGDTFGDDLTQVVGEEFIKAGGRFAPGARYSVDSTEYSRPINQLAIQLDAYIEFFGRTSSAIYAVAFDEIATLLEQASKTGELKHVRWFGSDGIALNYALFANPAALQYMMDVQLLSPIFSGDRSQPEFQRIRAAIEKELGQKVRPYAVLVYDAVVLAARARQSLGALHASGIALRDSMITISNQMIGASGALNLDSNGDRMPGDYEFWRATKDSNGNPDWELGAIYSVAGRGFELR